MKKENKERLQEIAGIKKKPGTNEIFGLSRGEKEKARLKAQIAKAKEEVANTTNGFLNLFFQPGGDLDRQSIPYVRQRLDDLAKSIPTVAALLPSLFDSKNCGMSTAFHPKGWKGVVPSCIGYIVLNDNLKIDIELGKKRLMEKLDALLPES